MTEVLTTNYAKEFQTIIDDIDKLVTTPDLIKQGALSALQTVLKQPLNHTTKNVLNNAVQSLQNIQDSSIRENFRVIYSQMCILAVSALEATLKQYFVNACSNLSNINLKNERLKEIRITALDLVEHKLKYTQDFGQLILDKEKSNFQDLKSIKRVFSTYLNKELDLPESAEKKIAFYLECRHVLVHRGGKIDQKFIDSTNTFNANVKNYSLGQSIELDHTDWGHIKDVFSELVEETTKKRAEI